MATAVKWGVSAWFETQEQAKHAADMLKALSPRAYEFGAWDVQERRVWREYGTDYGATDVRV